MKHKLLKAFKWPWVGKRKYKSFAFLFLLILGLSVAGYFILGGSSSIVDRPNANSALKEEKKIETVASPLTGRKVPKKDAELPVTAIIVENSPNARPQSGLSQAGVVFEAIAEGGVTRFLTLFQETSPKKIGPVRSLRPYFIDWLMGFDASIAHVGGSPDALKQVKELGLKDLDQFFGGSYFYRSSDRYAPHNVYTSRKSLRDFEKSRGYNDSNFTPLPRKEPSPADNPSATKINFDVSYPLYEVSYKYDKTTNSYVRSMGGKPHIDREGNTRINPEVVVAISMNKRTATTGHTIYDTIGTGSALVFQDGKVTSGTWTKLSRESQISLKNSNGEIIKLNPGQTWFHAVETTNEVSYRRIN